VTDRVDLKMISDAVALPQHPLIRPYRIIAHDAEESRKPLKRLWFFAFCPPSHSVAVSNSFAPKYLIWYATQR
jgi:hypothetical protein